MSSSSDADAIIAVANAQRQTTQEPQTSDTDRDSDLWPEIRRIIETRMSSQPRDLQREIGPSELGTSCVHCLAAKLAGWPERRRPAWLPFIGTCVHARFEQWFQESEETVFTGPAPEDERRRFTPEMRVTVGHLQGLHAGYDVKGSIDLYDRKTGSTIDWKIVGNATLTKVKAHGPSQQYRVQASLYGIGLKNRGEAVRASRIYFLPRNKAGLNDALPWQAGFDPKPGLWALARAQLLVNLMDCIEQAEGVDVRDSWIKQLPAAGSDGCFQCKGRVWPDMGQLPEFDERPWPDVPDKWLRLIPLIDPEYPGTVTETTETTTETTERKR